MWRKTWSGACCKFLILGFEFAVVLGQNNVINIINVKQQEHVDLDLEIKRRLEPMHVQ
jgi:hypothetical protein